MKNFVVIDVGGTSVKFYFLAGRENKIRIKREISPTTSLSTPTRFINKLRAISQKIGKVDGVVIGIPGEYDKHSGKLLTSPNIQRWKGFNLKKAVQENISEILFVENDVNLITMGEIEKGIGKKLKNFILLAIGTGLGGGIVINGEVITGRGGGAGEIGHILIHPNGELCGCGRRGCLEAYASGSGIVKSYKRLGGEDDAKTAEKIYEMAKEGNPLAIAAFKTMGRYLGWGIGNLINIFEPDGIVLTGGVTSAKELFLADLKEALKERAFTHVGRKTPIYFSKIKYGALWGGVYKLKKEGLLPPSSQITLSL